MRKHKFAPSWGMTRRTFVVAVVLFVAASFLTLACHSGANASLALRGNAVYYWRTVFQLDSAERAFLANYNIKRIYCRYFDVVNNERLEPTPNATIQFAQSKPDSVEIVPVVFIMNDCMQQHHQGLAQKLVRRVAQMNETNDIGGVRELQIDCDYTARNRDTYYAFLKEVKREAAAHGIAVSTTVRLHQLAMPEPPVEYGVLMLYNTGDPARFAERNPILDLRDVKPYLRYLKDYSLPMAAAYPVFLWQREIHGTLINHVADFEDIVRTKRLVEAEREDLRSLILTYHLDSENLKRYTSTQYETIYHH